MRQYIVLVFILLFLNGISQENGIDTTINLDLLNSPVNPAFNMLGISSSDIHRPTDLSKFALSIQNATNNFSAIPRSYGIEIAPFLLGKGYTLNELNSKKNSIAQTLSISFGFTNKGPDGQEEVDSLISQKVGLGLKFSFIRPKWNKGTEENIRSMVELQRSLLTQFEENILLNEEKARLEALQMQNASNERQFKLYTDSLADVMEKINAESNTLLQSNEKYSLLKQKASKLKIEREGLFLDFNSGIVIDFPTHRFEYSKILKGGAWLTGGYTNAAKGLDILAIGRYLYQPESIFADPTQKSINNISTFDSGIKLLYETNDNKLSVSTEYLYRGVIHSDSPIPSNWRLVFNAEYNVAKNQKLTFSFGRNFDGAVSKGDNIISFLNFITGLGTTKKISSQPLKD